MAKLLSPRASGKFVSERAKHVTINNTAVEELAALVAAAVQENKLGYEAFKYNSVFPLDLGLSLKQLINWTFLIDALNFNFWTPNGKPKFKVTHGNSTRTGYLAMVLAVNRALAEGKPLCDPKYYGQLTVEDVKYIFRSDTASQLPLFDQRVRILKEISTKLDKNYNGCFSEVVKEADGDALNLVDLITSNFPCFNDIADYQGQAVSLFKRAQILVADLDLLYAVKGLPGLRNVRELSMFADYRVPQVLAYFGVFSYSDTLLKQLNEEYLFENGSLEEVEIRACSIEAVERLVASTRVILQSRGWSPEKCSDAVNSVRVDYFLWDYRVQHARKLAAVPYHRTRCYYY